MKTQPSNRKKGHSKKAHVLVAAVAKATEAFIKKGEEIANEIPEIRKQKLETVADVREKGLCSVIFARLPLLWLVASVG